MTPMDRATRLFVAWQAACRADPVLAALGVVPEGPNASHLVREVVLRVFTAGGASDGVFQAAAAGLAAYEWRAGGEGLQLQLGLLLQVVVADKDANVRRAALVHTILSAAAAKVAVKAWQDEAEQDKLTELRNRAGWEHDRVKYEEAAAPVQYASIDLDGLKAINDSQGHDAGDTFIQTFARRLEIEIVTNGGGGSYRCGGDEFAAVLPADSADLATILGDLAAKEDVPPFSFGVASWPTDDNDFQSVLSLADRRMYEQKQRRKDENAATAALTHQ